MSGLEIIRGNRTELLLEHLAEVVAEPLSDPLQPEWIVVPTRGLGIWLGQGLASRLGIWTHCTMPYPRRFVRDVVERIAGRDPSPAGSDPDRDELAWRVLATIPRCLHRPEFGSLAHYFDEANDPHGLERHRLARAIAEVFDGYRLYRGDFVRDWERGGDLGAEEHPWQPVLWRELASSSPPGDELATAITAAITRLTVSDVVGLPTRISIFGVSTMPPPFTRLVVALARRIDVHLFLPTPSLRLSGAGGELHPLLASMGVVSREFATELADAVRELGVESTERDLSRAPEPTTMLSRLQHDVWSGERSPGVARVAPSDCSLAVHSCHGPTREVEVVHDQLLELFRTIPDLMPHEVAIMTPQIETYAPLVEAVFGREGETTNVPHHVADRSIAVELPLLRALDAILRLSIGRFTAAEVLDAMQLPAVQRRFDLRPADIERLTQWIDGSGIRSGIDAEHRRTLDDLPAGEGTWRFGLERLLLGYAMPCDDASMFAGRLPHEGAEGQDGELLGRLLELCERLFAAVDRHRRPRNLRAWREEIGLTVEQLLAVERDDAWQLRSILRALDLLAEESEKTGFVGEVALPWFRELLLGRVDDVDRERSFLCGGVVVCGMLPMRAIPFKVVCLLGMNDGAFPRATRTPAFDLISARPLPGDRSARDDDRGLFLETLMAARDRLLITYVGQSLRDGSVRPPAVVVSELLDEVAVAFDPAPAVVSHRIQPFSPRYFDGSDPRLFSFAARYVPVARAMVGERRPPRPLFTDALPERPVPTALTLHELLRFFRGPARYLMERRLGVYLRDRDIDVPDHVSLELDGLERWKVGDRLLGAMLSGREHDASAEVLIAEGLLPPGRWGRELHTQLRDEARAFLETLGPVKDSPALDPLAIDLRLPGLRLIGRVGQRREAARVHCSPSAASGKTLLRLWIEHLACAAVGDPRETVMVFRRTGKYAKEPAQRHRMAVPERSLELLADLVDLFRVGTVEPLRFFPQTSWTYVEEIGIHGDRGRALDRARNEWVRGNDAEGRRGGEWDRDPYHRRVFPQDALDEGFQTLSVRVFEPLRAHLDGSRGRRE